MRKTGIRRRSGDECMVKNLREQNKFYDYLDGKHCLGWRSSMRQHIEHKTKFDEYYVQ
jgi:hypothetical protein